MKILDNKFINYNYYYDDNSIDLIHDGMEDIIIIDGQKYIQDNFDELWRYDNINDNWEKGFRDDMILVQVAAETMLNTFYDFCDSLGVVCDSLDYHALEDYSYEQGLYYFISFPNTQDIINVMKAFEKFEHHDFRGRIISLIDVLEYSSSTPEIAHIGFNTYTYYPNGLSTLYLNSNQDRHIKYELLPDRFIIYSDSSVYETKIETLCETLSCDIIDVKGNVYLLEKNGQKTLINIMKEFESHDEKFSVQGISEESFETLEKIDHYYYMMVDGHVFVPFSYMSDRISGNLFGVTFKEGVTDNQVKNLSDSLNVEIVRQNSSTVSNGCVMEIKAYQNIIDIMKVYYDSNLFDRVGIVRLYTAL
jgi:hypothetical protein